MCLFTSLSLQKDDFVCVVGVSAAILTAERMTELSLALELCPPLLVTAEMAVVPGSV